MINSRVEDIYIRPYWLRCWKVVGERFSECEGVLPDIVIGAAHSSGFRFIYLLFKGKIFCYLKKFTTIPRSIRRNAPLRNIYQTPPQRLGVFFSKLRCGQVHYVGLKKACLRYRPKECLSFNVFFLQIFSLSL